MSALADANKELFNVQAEEYDSKPWMRAISQQIGTALQERKEFIGVKWYKPGEIGGREVKMLDYACGTGSITKALGPLVTRVIGIDVSENMVKKYNEEAESAGLKPEQVSAVVGDLLADEVPAHLKSSDYYNFDLAVVGLGFHHFDNPLLALQRLTERLKPDTGVLMIIDFLPFNTNEYGESAHTIKHGGFSRADLEALHKSARLQKFNFDVVEDPVVMELKEGPVERTLFISRANKEPTAWGFLTNWVYEMQIAVAQSGSFSPVRGDRPGAKLGMTGQTVANVDPNQRDARQENWYKEMAELGKRK